MATGLPCVFPFKFMGMTFEQCQMFQGNYMCATEVNAEGNLILGKQGICGENCPKSE